MASDGRRPSHGVVCLGNDAVLDWTIAFCESVHQHDPELPLTLIPFDDRVEKTTAVLDRYGYGLYEGPMLARMDAVGKTYFSDGGHVKKHIMRKFCAWDVYDEFLYLDCDIVVVASLAPYFPMLARSGADFVHFATDMVQVYREGPLRERMIAAHGAAGFNSGAFMGRRGDLTAEEISRRADEAADLRPEFVDNLEQTLINYCVDVSDLKQADATEVADVAVVAGALIRLVDRDGRLILDDRRVPYSGRPVSAIHWAGYGIGPLMPYRKTFLRYRLAGADPRLRWRYQLDSWAKEAGQMTPRHLYHSLRGAPYRLRGWLSARGLAEWHGSNAG
jgi:hypothetical protein